MFFEIERIISHKRPKAFLLENVKQLKGHDKGNTLNTIVSRLKALNYTVDYKVLRAADFGVPQNRERIYIVGFNKSVFKIDKNFSFDYPIPKKTSTRLGSILEKDVDDKYTISDKLYQGHLRRKEEHKQKGNGFGFSLFNENSPYTNTISARYYKDGSEILIDQGKFKNPRKLTPRECARLQGFPEDFIIPVSDTQAYKQFGNAVTKTVVQAIGGAIKDFLDRRPRKAQPEEVTDLSDIAPEDKATIIANAERLEARDEQNAGPVPALTPKSSGLEFFSNEELLAELNRRMAAHA